MSIALKLVADIGGTNARFALYDADSDAFTHARTLSTTDYDNISAAITAYFAIVESVGEASVDTGIRDAAIAIANPVTGDDIQMTNHHWHFSINALQAEFGFTTLTVINDFVAQALAVLTLQPQEKRVIAHGTVDNASPIAVVGPGTGLGVSFLTPPLANQPKSQWRAFATEGGHVSLAPRTPLEINIWRYAQRIHGEHISAERLLCGSGLALIDDALAQINACQRASRSPQDITAALAKGDKSAQATVDVFASILATVCADVILTTGARGGLYLCGGILPRMADYLLKHSPFYERFIDKGRFSEYLSDIPITLVLAKDSGLRGAAVALCQQNNLSN